MLSPVNLSAINPAWSVSIILGKTFLIRLAIVPDAILYVIFNNEMGLQFLYIFCSYFLWEHTL